MTEPSEGADMVIEVPAQHFAFDAPWNSPDPVRAELGQRIYQTPSRYRMLGKPLMEWRLTADQFSLLTDYKVPVTPGNVASIKIFGLPILLVMFEHDSTVVDT